jgi:hypothetical protein
VTLFFKVNFNAGVVGAGEAVIESTVTGNSPLKKLTLETVLQDQSQVYLPINNALSSVGHVFLFLDQLGQGEKHESLFSAQLFSLLLIPFFSSLTLSQEFSM